MSVCQGAACSTLLTWRVVERKLCGWQGWLGGVTNLTMMRDAPGGLPEPHPSWFSGAGASLQDVGP